LLKQFCNHEPIFAIVDVRPEITGLPTTTYESVEELTGEGKELQRVFKNISCRIEAGEAEEVGVEHLLRDINDPSTSLLTYEIKQKLRGLVGLRDHLAEVSLYLQRVLDGQMPVNNQIIANLQNIFNLLPNLNLDETVNAMLSNSNDIYQALYLAVLVRSVMALHDLLANKLKYRGVEGFLETGTIAPATISGDEKVKS
jgi:26S proteasome regulatory subunit N8